MRIKILILVITFLIGSFYYAPVSFAQDEIAQDEIAQDDADPILGLKLEMLNWKKKYYLEHSLALQLKAMNQVWNDIEFQETQRQIRETDGQLKQLTILH